MTQESLKVRVCLFLIVAILSGTMISCGGGGSTSTSSPPPPPPPTLQSIAVSPNNPSIVAGTTQQYAATGTYSDGSQKNLTSSATWSSSNTNVATISAAGLATTLTEGSSTITATLLSTSGSTSLTATHLTVNVSVTATDPNGHSLTYLWQATDGSILNIDEPTTAWTLPDGPGLHFAYVLVSNGLGGYTERRIILDTDSIGTPLITVAPVAFSPPPPAVINNPYNVFRGFMSGGNLTSGEQVTPEGTVALPKFSVSVPDVPLSLGGNGNGPYPSTGTVSSNNRGEFFVPGVSEDALIVDGLMATCNPSGNVAPPNLVDPFQACGTVSGFGQAYPSVYASLTDYSATDFDPAILQDPGIAGGLRVWDDVAGQVLLKDGSTCGIDDEFFGVNTSATATLLDGSGNVLAGPVPANEWGDYDLPYLSNAASVSLNCEGNSAVKVAITNPNTAGTTSLPVTLMPSAPPTVTTMTATLPNGNPLPSGSATFAPPPTGAPSDIVPLGDAFLSEKGVDSKLGACQYYKAVGAVKSCDAQGNASGAITFNDWKSQVQIDQYAPNPPNVPGPGGGVLQTAFINAYDLNLARVHHSVDNGGPLHPFPTLTTTPWTYIATYVCNHLGPKTTSQADIDTAIGNAVNGPNEVACVTMDYSTSPTGNGFNGPYIRFLIFGPSGQLLPSVNLDGRREKFVPGVCVVCHGADNLAGKYPEDGSGPPDVGGHFLPYDEGNFEYSSQPGLTHADITQIIYSMNQNIRSNSLTPSVPITDAENTLINGWYGPSGSFEGFNANYVDPSWTAANSATNPAIQVYQQIYAHDCRTCHVAQVNYNFEPYGRFLIGGPVVDPVNCGSGTPISRDRMYKMPNSLATFNLFWGTQGTANDLVKLYHQFQGCPTNNPSAPNATSVTQPESLDVQGVVDALENSH